MQFLKLWQSHYLRIEILANFYFKWQLATLSSEEFPSQLLKTSEFDESSLKENEKRWIGN